MGIVLHCLTFLNLCVGFKKHLSLYHENTDHVFSYREASVIMNVKVPDNHSNFNDDMRECRSSSWVEIIPVYILTVSVRSLETTQH